MADRYERRYYSSRYMEGNAARAIEAPERRYNEPARKPVRQPERQPEQETIQKRKKVSLVSVFITLAAIFAAFYMCVNYVMVYSDIIATEKEISKLESSINRMEQDNKAAYESIDSSVDLQEVYKTATEKLGMAHATDSQVYTYDDKLSDRVIQYSDIPN